MTEELEQASAQTASVVLERILEVGISRGLDKALFSTNAATAISPAGLLNGVTVLPAGTSMSGDLGAIVGSIADAGYDSEETVFIANTKQALAIRLIAGPKFDYRVIGTPVLPGGTVVGIDTSALAFAYAGYPQTETKRETTLHFADTPLPLVDNRRRRFAKQERMAVRHAGNPKQGHGRLGCGSGCDRICARCDVVMS
jgi:hypothetical protein